MDNRDHQVTKKTPKPKRTTEAPRRAVKKLASEPDMQHMITVVVSVVVILFVVWFLASQFMNVTGKSLGAIPASESEMSESETASEASSASAQAPSSSAAHSSELAAVPEKKTEGRADFQSPDSWIGKKFVVDDGANVRSGPGTNNGTIEGVSPGAKVTVIDAQYVADATWVHGIIDEGNGKPYLGWLYSYALTPDPID